MMLSYQLTNYVGWLRWLIEMVDGVIWLIWLGGILWFNSLTMTPG